MLRELLDGLIDRADVGLLPAVYRRLSVKPRRERARLRLLGRPFVDPELRVHPPLPALDETGRWVVDQGSSSATMLAGTAAMAGLMSMPPEALGHAVGWVRMAQRIGLVYGFEPGTRRGELAVWRALAHGLDIEFPLGGPVDMRLSALVRSLRRPGSGGAASKLAGSVLKSSAVMVATRATRLVPVVFSGWSAAAARRRHQEIGDRVLDVLRRLAETAAIDPAIIEDVVEVPGENGVTEERR